MSNSCQKNSWINAWIRGLGTGLLVVMVLWAGAVVNAQPSAPMETIPPAVEQPEASQSQSQAVAREQLEKILSDPIFHRWEFGQDDKNESQSARFNELMDTAEGWLDGLFDWIADLFPRTPKPFHGSEGTSSWATGAVFKVIACVLGVILLVFVIIVIVRMLREPAQPASTRILSRKRLQEALEQGQALATDSSQWITEAMRLAQDNDLRLAYRAMYLALLSGLHQQRNIDFHQQRTNWTYVEHFRGEAASRKSFASLTKMFDDVWYGLGQPESAKLQEVRLQIDALLTPPARREAR